MYLPKHDYRSRDYEKRHHKRRGLGQDSQWQNFKTWLGNARRTALVVLLTFIAVYSAYAWLFTTTSRHRRPPQRFVTEEFGNTLPGVPYRAVELARPFYASFGPVYMDDKPLSLHRRPDILDTFENYAYRDHSKCNISSMSLHRPFSPLCPDRQSFLEAFNSGGRIGFDTPYMPLDCDMRWFTTEEICEIFGRFEKVIVVGDSMMRHVVGALNVLLRKDLGYGAVTGWNFGEEELEDCFCTHQMDVKACSVQGVYRTEDVLKNDPDSFACPKRSVKGKDGKTEVVSDMNLIIELMLKFPLDPTELKRLQDLLPKQRPDRPIAFVFGHGLWNDLDLQATVHWFNGILDAIYEAAPYLRPDNLPREPSTTSSTSDLQPSDHGPMSHILFVTPSAAGVLKPDQWVQSQGDKALQIFETSVHNLIHRGGERFTDRGIEHMGTWNMSIQMDKWDGVHLNLRGNLLKAMGVVNWLGGIAVEAW